MIICKNLQKFKKITLILFCNLKRKEKVEKGCTFKPHLFKSDFKYKKSSSISIGEYLYSQRNNSPNKIKQQKDFQLKELNENSSKIHLLNKSEELFYKKKQKSFKMIFNLLSDKEETISLYKVNWKS